LELTIMTAASIAAWGFERRYQVGLATNGMHRMSWTRLGLEPSGDPAQPSRLLETLGRLQRVAIRPFERTLAEEVRRLAFGTTVVVVSALLTPLMAATLLAIRRRGHPVTVVLTGRQAEYPRLEGIVMRRTGPPQAWREHPALVLTHG